MATTFLSSTAVQVYPCAYRGTNAEGELYNPEAQLNTEFNLTNIKNIDGKKSWVINWEETSKKLKCVIGGYYFDLDLSASLDETFANSTAIYAYIKVLPMATVDNTNTKYPAYTLSDVDGTSAGTSLDDDVNFKGVKLADSAPTGENIIYLYALNRNNTTEKWRVNSNAWLLNTNNIMDVAENEPVSSTFTTLHLVGAETGDIEELKVDKVQSYLTSQIDIDSDVNIFTLGVDTITTRTEPSITIDRPFELRTPVYEGDVNFFRVVNEKPDSTDEVYIDNTVVQVASQSQDLVSILSKEGLSLNHEDINRDVTNKVNLTPYSITFGESSNAQLLSALTPRAIRFRSSDDGVTTYHIDSITRQLEDSNSSPIYTLKIPSKNGTIATLDDIYNNYIYISTVGTDGTLDLFSGHTPTKNHVMFTLILNFEDNHSISLGRIVLRNDGNTYSFLCGNAYKYTTGSSYSYKAFMILIDTSNWKLTILVGDRDGASNSYSPYNKSTAATKDKINTVVIYNYIEGQPN